MYMYIHTYIYIYIYIYARAYGHLIMFGYMHGTATFFFPTCFCQVRINSPDPGEDARMRPIGATTALPTSIFKRLDRWQSRWHESTAGLRGGNAATTANNNDCDRKSDNHNNDNNSSINNIHIYLYIYIYIYKAGSSPLPCRPSGPRYY